MEGSTKDVVVVQEGVNHLVVSAHFVFCSVIRLW